MSNMIYIPLNLNHVIQIYTKPTLNTWPFTIHDVLFSSNDFLSFVETFEYGKGYSCIRRVETKRRTQGIFYSDFTSNPHTWYTQNIIYDLLVLNLFFLKIY